MGKGFQIHFRRNLQSSKVGGFLILLFGLMSISTLTAISLLRYIKGCQPHKAHMVDQRHVTMAIVFIWISSIFWSGSPVLGWGSFTERKYGTCEIDWVQAASSTVYKSYVIGVFIWGFVLPVSIMVFCYVSIIRTVHKSHRNSRGGEISQRQLTMERDITRVSFVICTAFLLAWSPYAVISMWSACGYQVPGLTGVAATLLAKSASFYNPIIYLGMSPKFRQELRALLCCLRQSGDSPQSFEKPVITHEPKMKQCNSPSNSLAAKMEQPVLGAQGIQESTLIKGAADSLTVNSQTSDPVKNIDISLDFPMESHQI
ncbi:hypothetical protein XENTR_v10022011 [Xenopus tropicalis]|nr:hypothetical protein XENTR_v10022011 [Xenopus tropicalis]